MPMENLLGDSFLRELERPVHGEHGLGVREELMQQRARVVAQGPDRGEKVDGRRLTEPDPLNAVAVSATGFVGVYV